MEVFNSTGTGLESPSEVNETSTAVATVGTDFTKTDITMMCVLMILIVMGTFGNFTSLIVMIRRGPRKDSGALLLAVLAVSDIIELYFGAMWQFVYAITKNYIDFDVYIDCGAGWFFYFFSYQYSAWLLVIITTERFICVCFPLKTVSLVTIRNVRVAVCVVGFIIFCINFPHFVVIKVIHEADYAWCGPVGERNEHYIHHIWPYIDMMTYCFIPAFTMFLMNTSIIIKLISQTSGRKIRQTENVSQSNASRKITVMLMSISIFFICMVVPAQTLFILGLRYDQSSETFNNIIREGLVTVNHSMNFYLYVLTGQKFRKDVAALFRCRGTDQSDNKPREIN